MKFKEFLTLFFLNMKVSVLQSIQYCKIILRYYSNFRFAKADLYLRFLYLFSSPFKICKEFLVKRGDQDPYTYGETPLTTLALIAKEANIISCDCIVELGSARGINCFWLNSIVGCKVIGIEEVPEFVMRAQKVKEKLNFSSVEFILADFLDKSAPFPVGSCYYLYGSCLDEDSIKILVEKLEKLPRGTKIITVSYPLSDYSECKSFEILKHFIAPFTWGQGDVYIQVKK